MSLIVTFLFTQPVNTYAQAPAVHPYTIKSCWYSTPTTQIFKVLYDNVTHSVFGSSVYIWIKDGAGTVYGPISPSSVTFDPLTGGWYYEYDAVASGVTLPTPLQTCYNWTCHYMPNYVEPYEWFNICLCDDTACDARFNVFFGSSLSIGAVHITCNPGYTYSFDYGDGSPIATSVAPYCVGLIHTYPSAGMYTICCTATNGMNTCKVCKTICVNEDDNSGGGDPNERQAGGNAKEQAMQVNNGLQLYPVPAENSLKCDYTAKEASTLTMSITDIKGVEIKKMQQNVEAGKNNFTVDIESLQPGVYFVKLINGKEVVTRKFTKSK